MSASSVPLRPIDKSGLVIFWLGIVALLAVAVSVAVAQTADIGFIVVEEGEGESPTLDDIVLVNYEGRLSDGTVFDSNQNVPFQLAQLVTGMQRALLKMKKGGKYKIEIPPHLGYGNRAAGPIPANSTLYFDMELIDFRSESEVRAMQRAAQSQQQAQRTPPQ